MTISRDGYSRRSLLRRLALFGAGLAFAPWLIGAEEGAPVKLSKAQARYQDMPYQGRMCMTCAYFIPSASGMMGPMGGMGGMGMGGMMAPGQCQLVSGPISPMGYCVLYKPRA